MHLVMSPTETSKWNNESSPVKVWIDKVTGGTVSKKTLSIANPTDKAKATESREMRTAEVEFKADADASECKISGFVLYSICESETGKCMLLRQNFAVTIPVVAKARRSRR